MKIALITPYDVDCGIAEFSATLRHHLVERHDVEIFPLPAEKLKRMYGADNKDASSFVESLIARIRQHDAAIIQFEYSVMADETSRSIKILKILLDAHINTTITFHTLLGRGSIPITWHHLLRSSLNSHSLPVEAFLQRRRQNMEAMLLGYIKKRGIKVIVHTQSSERYLRSKHGLTKVYSHPLSYTTVEERHGYQHSKCRKTILEKYGISPTSQLVGVFGFMGEYKGFDIALRALALTPKEYTLLVFSGLHPNSIMHRNYQQINALEKLSSDLGIAKRVLFLGHASNEELYTGMAGVDYAWLPYRENGQEASGIASQAFELARRVIVSRNIAFTEYTKFGFRNDFLFSECGAANELSQKTINYDTILKSNGIEITGSSVDHARLQTDFYESVLKI